MSTYVCSNIKETFDLLYEQLNNNNSLSYVKINQYIESPTHVPKLPAVNILPVVDRIEPSTIEGNKIHHTEFEIQCIQKIRTGKKFLHLIDDVYNVLKNIRSNESYPGYDFNIKSIGFAIDSVSNVLLGFGRITIIADGDEEN